MTGNAPAAPVAFAAGRVESTEEAVRRVALVLLLTLGLCSIGLAAWSLGAGGIGLDTRMDRFSALTTRSIDGDETLQQAYDQIPSDHEFYGLFVGQTADLLHTVTTGSTAPLGPDDPITYRYEAVVTLTLAVVAVTALAAVLTLATGSLLAAAFAWSLTLATPLWLGLEQVDFKDVPVAAGMTLVTSGLALAYMLSPRRRAALVGVAVAGAGGAVALATRPASIVLLGALVAATLATAIVLRRRDLRAAVPVVFAAIAVPVCGLVFVWLTNPLARLGMVQWLHDSIDLAKNFPSQSTIRTAGQDLPARDLPWWYVPSWLGVQLPLLTLVSVLGGIGVVVARVRRVPVIPLVPIAVQAVGIPLLIVVSGAVLYDGIRHLLFALPALLALPALALAVLDRGRWRVVLPLAAVVVVAASLASAISWSPYAYAYLNPIGAIGHGEPWALDYWGVSAKEGAERLQRDGLDPIYVKPSQQAGVPWGAYNSFDNPTPGSGLYIFFRAGDPTDFGCKVLFTIERGGHPLGVGERC